MSMRHPYKRLFPEDSCMVHESFCSRPIRVVRGHHTQCGLRCRLLATVSSDLDDGAGRRSLSRTALWLRAAMTGRRPAALPMVEALFKGGDVAKGGDLLAIALEPMAAPGGCGGRRT